MKDAEGNEVNVGDVVKVLHIRDHFVKILADDEKLHTLGMLNRDFEIGGIVNEGAQVSVSYWVQEQHGCKYGAAIFFQMNSGWRGSITFF